MDINKPLDTDFVSIGDDDIRATKLDIENALKVEHDFPVNIGLPKARHKFPYGNSSSRPTGYDGRLYFNTTQKVIEQYQSGWKQIASLIPVGSKMLFYQATAPLGWTRKFDYDDKMLRLVNDGNGGTTGGTNWFLPTITTSTFTMNHNHWPEDKTDIHDYVPIAIAEAAGVVGAYLTAAASHLIFFESRTSPNLPSHFHTIIHDGLWRPKMTSVIVAEKF